MPIVIIHGWSDHAASFQPLQNAVAASMAVPVTTIWQMTHKIVSGPT
jgi:hypothetical protein